MRWIAAAVILCLSAGAQAEELCSSGAAKAAPLEATVLVSKKDKGPPVTSYLHVAALSADGAYRLSVHYDPTEAGLGTPVMTYIDISMPAPDPEKAENERIEWRAGSGAWFNPGYWGTPQRTGSDPKEMSGSVHYTIAQGRVHPYRTELLERFGPGVRWEFRRFDRNGREIGRGAVDYPPSKVIAGLYQQARAQAVAGLRPCGGYGPAMIAAPAPRPTAPQPPADPAAIDARACSYLRGQQRIVAAKPPPPGGMARIVGQAVDCGRRSVVRIHELKPLRKSERRELGAAVQSMSDKLWCSSGYFHLLIGRGWTFGLEFRAPGDPAVIAATTRKCPG